MISAILFAPSAIDCPYSFVYWVPRALQKITNDRLKFCAKMRPMLTGLQCVLLESPVAPSLVTTL